MFRFPAAKENYLYPTLSRLAIGPNHPPFEWIPEALSLGIKRPGREAAHSPTSSGAKLPFLHTSS
jgi:hypothetical protein